MDVREKLVEMSEQLRYCADVSDCANCKRWDKVCENQCVDNLLWMAADLIDEVANGVTVQELDGCEYCKEDREGYRKMFGAFSITNPFHGNEWLINTGHCKPRQIYFCPMCGRRLPQPPKGE